MNLTRQSHLLSIGFRKLAGPDPEGVLQPDPDVASHGRRLSRDSELVFACAEHRPLIIASEQPVGRALHVRHVLRMRTDAAEQAENALDEERRLDKAALDEMGQRIKMPDIVAFDLEPGAVLRAGGQDVLDIREGIAENAVTRTFEVGEFPIVLELLESVRASDRGRNSSIPC